MFAHTDLRTLSNCVAAAVGCEQVYNLAADMGGMGFIESNQSVLLFNNTMISECNVLLLLLRLLLLSCCCCSPAAAAVLLLLSSATV